MTIDNNRFNRIDTVYKILQATPSSMSELAAYLGVSTKTIQRDFVQILSKNGIIKDGKKLCIDKTSTQVDSSEKTVLAILDEMAKGVGAEFYGKAHMLISELSQNIDHHIFAYNRSESLSQSHITYFMELEKAINAKHIITMTYPQTKFTLKPLKLAFFDGFWYLLALDVKSKDRFKKFHIKSIENLTIIDKVFDTNIELEERLKKANSIWFQLDTEPFDVKLMVDKDYIVYFERKPLKTQSITGKDSDGSVEITVEITNEMEIMPIILSSIPYVRVLEPEWLADEVKERIGEYMESISI